MKWKAKRMEITTRRFTEEELEELTEILMTLNIREVFDDIPRIKGGYRNPNYPGTLSKIEIPLNTIGLVTVSDDSGVPHAHFYTSTPNTLTMIAKYPLRDDHKEEIPPGGIVVFGASGGELIYYIISSHREIPEYKDSNLEKITKIYGDYYKKRATSYEGRREGTNKRSNNIHKIQWCAKLNDDKLEITNFYPPSLRVDVLVRDDIPVREWGSGSAQWELRVRKISNVYKG